MQHIRFLFFFFFFDQFIQSCIHNPDITLEQIEAEINRGLLVPNFRAIMEDTVQYVTQRTVEASQKVNSDSSTV